jgi:hypothetical protein
MSRWNTRVTFPRRLWSRIAAAVTVVVSTAAVAVVLPTGSGAQSNVCRADGDVHVCRTEGFGTIFNNDVAQAKGEAEIDARRRAVEHVAGVRVDTETVTRNEVLFDDIVRTRSAGLIRNDRVVEHGKTSDGSQYRVLLEAWVTTQAVNERLEELVSDLSMVVLVSEQNMGRPQTPSVIDNDLVSALVAAGYRVLDPTHLRRVLRRDELAALERGDARAARDIRLRFLANLIVYVDASTQPSQNNQGIISAHGRASARVVEAETARIVANVALEEVKGFATSVDIAGQRALRAAGKPLAEQIAQGLDGYFKRKDRTIEVRLRNLPSLDEYRRAKQFLEQQRWVSGVQEGGYAPDTALIRVTYPEKTLYLASRLEREARYRLVEFDRNRILVEFRR